jgi:hypothetical protein
LPYSVDTSGLLDGWVRYYSPEVFPSLWKQMEAAAADGTIRAVQDVLLELEKQDDDVCAWAKEHITFVALEDQIQTVAIQILAQFPQLVNPRRSRSVADPFVIALAQVQGLTVVTAERASGSVQKPRMPDVCAGLGVKCIPLLGMFKELGWQF